MDPTSPHQQNQNVVTSRELLKLAWNSKWLGIGLTLGLAVAAGIAAYAAPKAYKAVVVLSPATNASANQLSGLASQFGGLASLAGISVGGGDSQKAESIAILQSESLTEKYIERNDLTPLLFKNDWDAQKMQWKNSAPDKVPTLWRANAYFKKNIRGVSTDPKTGLIILSITYDDANVAAKWANDLVKMTNDYLRDKAVNESERNIAYLNEEAAKTSVLEARQAIYKILETEINKVMLARGNNEYAFKILDPAFPPERPYSPNTLLWIVGGFFGGTLLFVLTILARANWVGRL